MSKKVTVNSLESNFYPFTLIRSFEEIKIGRFSFAERWKIISKTINPSKTLIPFNYLPTRKLLDYITEKKQFPSDLKAYCIVLQNSTDIVKHLYTIIETDILLLAAKKRIPVPETVKCTGKNKLFIEEGAIVKNCFIDTENGPVYITKNAIVQDGVCITGPVYIGTGSIIKMGATIFGATIIGDNCVAGGEIKNSVLMDFSNKAHFGYLGDSIIGQWCNLGAGTSNSNLKNNVSSVYLQLEDKKINAGIKFGMLMGDYSKSAIHTAFNTGTVVGVSTNIFGIGLTPKSIPSFSWGVSGKKYIFEKALEDIEKWMALKNKKMNSGKKKKLKEIFYKK